MRITFIFLLVCTFTSFLCAESLELRMLQLESKLVKQEERIEKLEKENGDFRKQIYALEQSQSVSESGNKGKMSGSKTVEDLSDGKKIVWIGLDERVGKYAKTDWDIYVRLVGRTKKTSVIRGDVFVYDLFNKVKYIQEYDITIPLKHDELTKGEMLEFGGMRFKSQRYSEVKRDWDWLRGAKKENMKVRYVVRSIAYADGSVESFK